MAVHVVDHPLVRHKLGILRKESTSTSEFRMLAKEIARLLMYEATKQFKTEKRTIKGWAGPVEVESISGKMVTIVPILRAGLGLMMLGNGVFRLCQDLHQGVLVQKIQGYHHWHTAHKFRDQAEFGQILGHGLL